jgi:long-chain acyl-CoA synthetase
VTTNDRQRIPETIAEVLTGALARNPERAALVSRQGRLSYAQLESEIEKAAAALHALGIRKGERVAASLPNSSDLVVAFHATARLGAIWVGLNRQLATPEKGYILEDSGARVLIAEPATLEALKAAHPKLRLVASTVGEGKQDDWRAMLAAAGTYPRPSLASSDPAGLAYTSGTTGRPKGVIHSHRNVLAPGAVQVATRPAYTSDMVKVDFLALTILNMVVLTTLLVSQAGGTSVILDTSDAEQIADWIQREKASVFQGVPAVLHSMIVKDSIKAEQLASVREVLTGSAATPEPLLAGFKRKFGLSIVGTYGMTEAPTMFAMERGDGSDHAPDSSGKALPHIDLFAEGADGKRLPPGETGELCARPVESGPWAGMYTLMLGYWNKPEATEAALKGGAIHTGDIGYLDSEGRVYITDRKNLMIIRGGANVYPAEIHRVLATDPRVADSAAFGIPDERLGERVVAAVELVAGKSATEEELKALCERELARYKVPERIIFVERFPRNAMNKIVRAELPKLYAAATRASG